MSIGHKVRYLRKKKQMKQEDLSKGICSVSYLSKIENEILKPSDETMQLLLRRLGYMEESNAITQIQELLSKWNMALMKRDEKESKNLYHFFQEKDFMNEGIQLEYRVLRLQYYLQQNRIAQVRKELVDLTEKVMEMPLKTRFYFFKHSAYYSYHVGKLEDAVTHIIESQKFISFLELSTIELADFYYAFSLVNSKNNDTKTAVKYAEMALSSYQTIYMLKKCVDCHIILGICHKRNFQYEMAFEHYEAAHTLAKEIDYHDMLPPIKHNLSSLYSILGQHEEALDLLQELYSEQKDLHSFTSARIVLSLVKEYCKVGRKSEAAQCLGKVYHTIHEDPSLVSLRTEYIFFDLMLRDQFEELDRKMEKMIIPELMKENKFLTLSSFCDYLGEYHVEQCRYKKSSYYFQLGKKLMLKTLQSKM
ncbi:MAG: helix-turn-helix domain-containing protein [Bacillota bacterium]